MNPKFFAEVGRSYGPESKKNLEVQHYGKLNGFDSGEAIISLCLFEVRFCGKQIKAALRMKHPLGRYWAEAWITQGYVDRGDKLPLVGIRGQGDANVLMRTVHFLFFKHNIHPLYLIDTIARITGMTW